jgi:D-glycerate 3-kinase
VRGPVDVVLFEGWMLGFAPRGDAAVAAVDADLLPVDAALRAYEGAWDSAVDAWLVIRVDDPNCVYRCAHRGF